MFPYVVCKLRTPEKERSMLSVALKGALAVPPELKPHCFMLRYHGILTMKWLYSVIILNPFTSRVPKIKIQDDSEISFCQN